MLHHAAFPVINHQRFGVKCQHPNILFVVMPCTGKIKLHNVLYCRRRARVITQMCNESKKPSDRLPSFHINSSEEITLADKRVVDGSFYRCWIMQPWSAALTMMELVFTYIARAHSPPEPPSYQEEFCGNTLFQYYFFFSSTCFCFCPSRFGLDVWIFEVLLIGRVSFPIALSLNLPVSSVASQVALYEVTDFMSTPRIHDWICKMQADVSSRIDLCEGCLVCVLCFNIKVAFYYKKC
ncbi:unnamed protein product, partial [Cuscuta epithymum]